MLTAAVRAEVGAAAVLFKRPVSPVPASSLNCSHSVKSDRIAYLMSVTGRLVILITVVLDSLNIDKTTAFTTVPLLAIVGIRELMLGLYLM